jgi:hypothetical protein
MKAKFFLSLLVLNGFLLGTNSASATEPISENQYDLASLSQTIAESIGFHPDTHSLIELAIGRALTAKKLNDIPTPPSVITAGVPVPSRNLSDTDRSRVTSGRIPQQPTPPVQGQVPLTDQTPIGKISIPTKNPPKKDPTLPTYQPAPHRVRYGGARG